MLFLGGFSQCARRGRPVRSMRNGPWEVRSLLGFSELKESEDDEPPTNLEC